MKKIIQTLLLTGIITPTLIYANDKSGFDYEIKGFVQNYSKFGFNDDRINEAEGKYPTESFSIISADLGIDMNLGAGFSAGIAGAAGGLIFDHTRFQRNIEGKLFAPNGISWNYFGFWPGPDYRSASSIRTTRNFILRNIYITYQYDKYIQAQIGRFRVPGDWFSGYVQGLYLQSWAIPHTKFWFYTTNRRASYGGPWLRDFKYINQNVSADNGKGFFVYAGGADIVYQNYGISPYIFAQDARFFAPGFHLTYDTNPAFKSEGFRSKTEIIFLHMQHFGPGLKRLTGSNNYKFGGFLSTAGKGGQSLYIRQRFDIDNYNIGLSVYKNFDNPNEFVTGSGDPTGFNNYNGSIYDGVGWNNIFRKDAVSGFLFGGGKYERFSWAIMGRLTFAPRADEQTLTINVDYKFPHNFKAGITAEYYGQTVKEGYVVRNSPILKKDIFQDRSSITTYIIRNF